ncbi:MAG: histidine kinase [Nitrosomonadales bacterium]|nr:histidine kinase [Nitrosomonadales bacterium]
MRHWIIPTLSSLLFNSAIAGLLTLVSFGGSFWNNFVFSQCIGLSIYAVNASVACRIADRRRRWQVLALAFPGSIFLGVSLGAWITGEGDWSDPRAWVAVVIGLFFGGIGGLTWFLSERIEQLDAEVKQRQLQQSETERRELEAQLKLLQAQIEPHFLFNTLANVGSLIETNPEAARRLLDRLNDWLRVALVRARSDHAILGDELNMLENYLEILKVRFGERLRWRIEADESARLTRFPPMLLQPLVENAVRHGIEPKLGGGEIVIAVTQANEQLDIEVSDNGVGLGSAPASGTGLANVRARLAALYGNAGRLELEDRADGGTTARLRLPR